MFPIDHFLFGENATVLHQIKRDRSSNPLDGKSFSSSSGSPLLSVPLPPRSQVLWEPLGLHKRVGTEIAHAPNTDGLDSNQAVIPKQLGGTMHYITFVLSIIGFGLELTAFLFAIAVI